MRREYRGRVLNRIGFPSARAGQAVGLLGGSFDPAHAGHVQITREAMRRFGLDRVWWLVSPGNPLKARGPQPIGRRIAAARDLIRDPRVEVSDIEARLGTRYTAATLARLRELYPGVRFVWLMGADNLAGFHRWQNWRDIAALVPIGVVARPGVGLAALSAPAARAMRHARLGAEGARTLPGAAAPAWCYVQLPLRRESSSVLRAGGDWPG